MRYSDTWANQSGPRKDSKMKRCNEELNIRNGSGHMEWKITNHRHHNIPLERVFCLHFEQSRRFKGRFKTHAMCCIIYKLLQGEKSRDTSQGLLCLRKQRESVINVIRDSLGISASLCGHIFSFFFNLALFFTDSAF